MKKVKMSLIAIIAMSSLSGLATLSAADRFLEGTATGEMTGERSYSNDRFSSKMNDPLRPDFDLSVGYGTGKTTRGDVSNRTIEADLMYKIGNFGISGSNSATYLGLQASKLTFDGSAEISELAIAATTGIYLKDYTGKIGLNVGLQSLNFYKNMIFASDKVSPTIGVSFSTNKKLSSSSFWLGLDGSYTFGYVDDIRDGNSNINTGNTHRFKLDVPLTYQINDNYSVYAKYTYDRFKFGYTTTNNSVVVGFTAKF